MRGAPAVGTHNEAVLISSSHGHLDIAKIGYQATTGGATPSGAVALLQSLSIHLRERRHSA